MSATKRKLNVKAHSQESGRLQSPIEKNLFAMLLKPDIHQWRQFAGRLAPSCREIQKAVIAPNAQLLGPRKSSCLLGSFNSTI